MYLLTKLMVGAFSLILLLVQQLFFTKVLFLLILRFAGLVLLGSCNINLAAGKQEVISDFKMVKQLSIDPKKLSKIPSSRHFSVWPMGILIGLEFHKSTHI